MGLCGYLFIRPASTSGDGSIRGSIHRISSGGAAAAADSILPLYHRLDYFGTCLTCSAIFLSVSSVFSTFSIFEAQQGIEKEARGAEWTSAPSRWPIPHLP